MNDELRAKHVQQGDSAWCAGCEFELWPCRVLALLDALVDKDREIERLQTEVLWWQEAR